MQLTINREYRNKCGAHKIVILDLLLRKAGLSRIQSIIWFSIPGEIMQLILHLLYKHLRSRGCLFFRTLLEVLPEQKCWRSCPVMSKRKAILFGFPISFHKLFMILLSRIINDSRSFMDLCWIFIALIDNIFTLSNTRLIFRM